MMHTCFFICILMSALNMIHFCHFCHEYV